MKKLTRKELANIKEVDEFLNAKFGVNTEEREAHYLSLHETEAIGLEDENDLLSAITLVENGNLTLDEVVFLAKWLEANLVDYTIFAFTIGGGDSVCLKVEGLLEQIENAETSLGYAILCDIVSIIKSMLAVCNSTKQHLFKSMTNERWQLIKNDIAKSFEVAKKEIVKISMPVYFEFQEPTQTEEHWYKQQVSIGAGYVKVSFLVDFKNQ